MQARIYLNMNEGIIMQAFADHWAEAKAASNPVLLGKSIFRAIPGMTEEQWVENFFETALRDPNVNDVLRVSCWHDEKDLTNLRNLNEQTTKEINDIRKKN